MSSDREKFYGLMPGTVDLPEHLWDKIMKNTDNYAVEEAGCHKTNY
jgi:hypothetical protein